MSSLENIRKCIQKDALVMGNEAKYLEEKKTKTKIEISSKGNCLQYDFEKIKDPRFPFFNEIKGLNAVADKVLFHEDMNGNLWVFVIELKQGQKNPKRQIMATIQLVEYLIKSVNRVCKTNYKPKVRGIGYSKLIRPRTKPKLKKLDDIFYISGKTFNLSSYMT